MRILLVVALGPIRVLGRLLGVGRPHGPGRSVLGCPMPRADQRHTKPGLTTRPPSGWPLPDAHSPAGTEFSGLTKAQAEELLDWLQNNGRTGCQLSFRDGNFTVRLA